MGLLSSIGKLLGLTGKPKEWMPKAAGLALVSALNTETKEAVEYAIKTPVMEAVRDEARTARTAIQRAAEGLSPHVVASRAMEAVTALEEALLQKIDKVQL